MNLYWSRSPDVDAFFFDSSISSTDLGHHNRQNSSTLECCTLPLDYIAMFCRDEGIEAGYLMNAAEETSTPPGTNLTQKIPVVPWRDIAGRWSGKYTYRDVLVQHYADRTTSNTVEGWLSFRITSVGEQGEVEGTGVDMYGPFHISGKLTPSGVSTADIMLHKEYVMPRGDSDTVGEYRGSITVTPSGSMEMTGIWGLPRPRVRWEDDYGRSTFKPIPIEARLIPPLLITRSPQSMWHYAFLNLRSRFKNTSRSNFKSKMNWPTLRTRREHRKRFIDLVILQEDGKR
ncbi:hypothetical protein C8Q80DRAFT_891781 [Daedaleopsis nitida]|nr:hypothetical protein C8Q80DRAFT_891781 [Daedaleopsis nitida]